MNVKKSYLGAGALAVGAVLAFALPAGASVNLQSESSGGSTLKIVKSAQLKAKGAATVVTVNVSCPAGSSYSVGVEVTQAINPDTATHGSNYLSNRSCTGAVEKVKVPVPAGVAPFKAGAAYAIGQLDVSGPAGYFHVDTGREIVNVA